MNDEIKLGRVGHYSFQKVCQTASIVLVGDPSFDPGTGNEEPLLVNVAGWTHQGDPFSRRDVPVGNSADSASGEFHLNRDCPWSK